MNASYFFLKYNGKTLDYDGINGGQCVDVTKAYFKEVVGVEPIKGDAIDYWRDIPGFERIPNGPFRWPKPGDIAVFDTSVNPRGHICIVNWVRPFDFGGFDQNFPLGSPCHYQEHTYKGLLGWLRPITKRLEVGFIGLDPQDTADLVSRFSKGKFGLDVRVYLHAPIQDFDTDQAMALIDQVGAPERFLLVGCKAQSGYDKTSYYPSKNKAFAVCPVGATSTTMVHELLHCVRKYINFNHIKPFIEDVERYPTSWGAGPEDPGWAFAEQWADLARYQQNL